MLRVGIIGAAVLLATAAQTAAAASPCPVGEARSLNSPFGEPITAGPVLIGCVRAPHIRNRELIAYREGKRLADSTLCVGMTYPDGSSWAWCGDPSRVHGLDNGFGASSTSDGAAALHGFASVFVSKATIRYWSYGKLRWQRLVLTRVTDPDVLGALGLSKPFAFYNVAIPPTARYLAFTARNAAGMIIHRRYVDCFLGLRCTR